MHAQGGSIAALHGRKPGMQPPISASTQLLASSVPATPQSPCNLSPHLHQQPRQTCLLGHLSGSGRPGPPAAAPAAIEGQVSGSYEACSDRVDLPELQALSTHCPGDASGPHDEQQPQPHLRRSQRRRTGVRLGP